MKIKCKTCRTSFEKRIHDKRDKNLFCSTTCALEAVRTPEHQVAAGKKGGIAKIAKYRGTGMGYVKEYGRHQHRVVMEKILGRKLVKGEIVHHIDHNKKNNDPSNLELMTQSEHISRHLKEGNGKLI